MSALIILVVVILWAGLGFVLWKSLVRPHVRSRWVLVVTTLALAGIWFIGPILDEILGAREFERACKEMREIKFYGPVPVGPGAFFDEQGNPRWKNVEEFSAIKRNTKAWYDLFDVREESTKLQTWPVPIFESRSTDFVKSSGQLVVESTYRASPGGWIKRATGWGSHAPYQCPSKGYFPKDQEFIVFKAR
ncbi:MAG TPA: hypothetical protein VF814_13740 [Casimicrobiaceae bacterium]